MAVVVGVVAVIVLSGVREVLESVPIAIRLEGWRPSLLGPFPSVSTGVTVPAHDSVLAPIFNDLVGCPEDDRRANGN